MYTGSNGNKKPVIGKPDGVWKSWYDGFLEELAASCNPALAANKAGCNRQTAFKHKLSCEAFSERWDKALDTGVALLEECAMDRAINGWLEPVYAKGECIDYKRKYSDTLTIFMLKHWRPSRYLLETATNVAGAYEDSAQAIVDARNRIIEHMSSLRNGNGCQN